MYQYTDQLVPSTAHQAFLTKNTCDTTFRQGYWRYVVERFFYVEEVMRALDLKHCIVLEYDVMIYTDLGVLTSKLKTSHQTCRVVCDNSTRCYPSCIYVPNADAIGQQEGLALGAAAQRDDDIGGMRRRRLALPGAGEPKTAVLPKGKWRFIAAREYVEFDTSTKKTENGSVFLDAPTQTLYVFDKAGDTVPTIPLSSSSAPRRPEATSSSPAPTSSAAPAA
jgi:hypothetical protein